MTRNFGLIRVRSGLLEPRSLEPRARPERAAGPKAIAAPKPRTNVLRFMIFASVVGSERVRAESGSSTPSRQLKGGKKLSGSFALPEARADNPEVTAQLLRRRRPPVQRRVPNSITEDRSGRLRRPKVLDGATINAFCVGLFDPQFGITCECICFAATDNLRRRRPATRGERSRQSAPTAGLFWSAC